MLCGFQSLDSQHEYRRSDATATRLSQIAASLLFDLGTIDIRRGDHNRRIRIAGCSESKYGCLCALARNDESCPSLGRKGMRHATRRATSEAFAHLLAVTAMLVIASVLFYRVEKPSQSKAQAVRQIEQSVQ